MAAKTLLVGYRVLYYEPTRIKFAWHPTANTAVLMWESYGRIWHNLWELLVTNQESLLGDDAPKTGGAAGIWCGSGMGLTGSPAGILRINEV